MARRSTDFGLFLESTGRSAPTRGAPHDQRDPLPPGGPPPANAPGGVANFGGSGFVPLAALLALLALAAPATLRRLGEVPCFPAPSPFVCALERPG